MTITAFHPRSFLRGLALLISLLLTGPVGAQSLFTKEIKWIGDGGRGIGFGDYDNDGWPEMILTGGDDRGERVVLWHNEEGTGFTDRSNAIQAEIADIKKGGGSIWGDYDKDGDLDLFLPVGGFRADLAGRNALLRNDRGVFRDVTLEAGLTDVYPTDNAIWLDYDKDGYIDLYTGNLSCGDGADPDVRNLLYRNNGDGSFTDVTAQAGLEVPMQTIETSTCGGGSNGGMVSADFDGDGWPDLYVGAVQENNRLFLNDGQGGFRDVTDDEIAQGKGDAFGTAVGDIDNDGDLDIFQATGGSPIAYYGGERPVLLLNIGEGQFLDVTDAVGLTELGTDLLGAGLEDIDNDGDLDLISWQRNENVQLLYLNDGFGNFFDASAQFGLSGWGYPDWFDYDLDGFLDVFLGSVFRNRGNDNHWLRVELAGSVSNRDGIGARVIATAGDLRQMREILGGQGYVQYERVAHFGLGDRTQVNELEIRWPSGLVEILTDIPVDRKIRIVEGSGTLHTVEPTLWEIAPPDTMVLNANVDLELAVRPALFEPDAVITRVTADLTPIGGPEDVLLEERGDGVYALRIPLSTSGVNGIYSLSVTIHQQTVLGPYWTERSEIMAVFPDRDLRILDEDLASNWKIEGVGGETIIDLGQSDVVYQGESAGAFQVVSESIQKGWVIECSPNAPVDPVGYTAIRFAFHPGGARGKFFDDLGVVVNRGVRTDLIMGGLVDSERQEWQLVEVPLNEKDPITSIRFTGNLEGSIYLDDIRLVAAPPPPSATAVVGTHASSFPQVCALDQNYPNPFNSDTVIRFALPEGDDVELAVFNLAGQQVATLVRGRREAGIYSVRWDGRDDRGRELASGVYLYRLRTSGGQQEKTRKLLLLK
jgi:enediyne biosynthesis protein E4